MSLRGPYQLSSPLDFGRYEREKMEDVIEQHPHYVADLVEQGIVLLAPGAARYLRYRLVEWEEEHGPDAPWCGLISSYKEV